MFGLILLLVILGVVAAGVAQSKLAIPCHLQPRWWRVTPPGVTPLQSGTANSLFAVLRLAQQRGAKSFNYSYQTKAYQIFSQWLVNWTQPIDIVVTGVAPSQSFSYTQQVGHVTGVLATPAAGPVPSPCLQKIMCEMSAHGMHPDGKSMRNWANAGGPPDVDTNYYDVAAIAKTWPTTGTENIKSPQPMSTAQKKPYIETALMAKLKASGQAITGSVTTLDATGAPVKTYTTAVVPPPCTSGACDFCGLNSTKQFWYGCNSVGKLFSNSAKTQTYQTPTSL